MKSFGTSIVSAILPIVILLKVSHVTRIHSAPALSPFVSVSLHKNSLISLSKYKRAQSPSACWKCGADYNSCVSQAKSEDAQIVCVLQRDMCKGGCNDSKQSLQSSKITRRIKNAPLRMDVVIVPQTYHQKPLSRV